MVEGVLSRPRHFLLYYRNEQTSTNFSIISFGSMIPFAWLSVLMLLLLSCSASASPAGTARWVAEAALWGTLTAPAPNGLSVNSTEEDRKQDAQSSATNVWNDLGASVLPIAASKEHNGRIFFYLMHKTRMDGTALTVSQASFNPKLFAMSGCGDPSNAVDAQDPRCAKVTFLGNVVPCDEECDTIAKQALFSAHPSMEHWPEDHDFHAHEMILDSIWMIASFGGGNDIPAQEYYQAKPSPHQISEGDNVKSLLQDSSVTKIPDWNNTVARARWITHHSRWGTVSSTQHNYHEGQYFGNIRSFTDGPYCGSSTGRPIFQFPDADPIAKDLEHTDDKIAITFSEASIAARVSPDTGIPCGGEDAGSPTCAQLILYGQAVPIDSSSVKFLHALDWFKITHPLAPWLSQGGSHMKGKYYTVAIQKILILDYFGGYQQVDVGDYLQYDMSQQHAGGEYCQEGNVYHNTDHLHEQGAFSQIFYSLFYGLVVTTCLMVMIRLLGCGRKTDPSYQAVVETTSSA
eukprot:scaffold2724_cov193-Amphora_coffeaeformis.AAC.2